MTDEFSFGGWIHCIGYKGGYRYQSKHEALYELNPNELGNGVTSLK